MAPEERQLLVNIEKDSVSRDEYGDLINEKELVRYYLNSNRINEARKYKKNFSFVMSNYNTLFKPPSYLNLNVL